MPGSKHYDQGFARSDQAKELMMKMNQSPADIQKPGQKQFPEEIKKFKSDKEMIRVYSCSEDTYVACWTLEV